MLFHTYNKIATNFKNINTSMFKLKSQNLLWDPIAWKMEDIVSM